jgi:hypothetical protein
VKQGPIGTNNRQAWKFAWPRDTPVQPPPGFDLRPGQIAVNRNYVDFSIAALGGGGGPSVPIRWVEVSDTPPAAQFGGKLWYDSTTGNTYVWFDDGTSAAWVQMAPGVPGETVPPATDTILGVITEPLPDGRQYARTWDAAGFWTWVEVQATPLDFGDGLTVDRTQTPNIVNLQPATDFSIGGLKEPPQTAPDAKDYVRRFNPAIAEGWEWAETAASAPYHFTTGLSFDDATREVSLDPAGPTNMGGVIVPPRDATTQALSIDMGNEALGDPATGELRAPPATDTLLGALCEPPQDGLSYARRYDAALVPPAWAWEPTVAAGLQITSVIPDKCLIDAVAADITVNAYGSEFTPTCVIMIDGVAAPTQPDTESHLTFTLDPGLHPAYHAATITVEDPAVPEIGAGGEQFEFILQATDVLSLTFINPNEAVWGPGIAPITVEAHGSQFTPTTVVLWDGVAVPTVQISNTELHFTVDATIETAARTAVVTVADGAVGLFDASFYFRDARVAGPTPDHAGVVFVPARTVGQGLTLEDDGGLYLRIATDQHLGGMLEPSERDVPHARVVDSVTGLGGWEEVTDGMEEPPISPTTIWGRSSGGRRGWLEIEHTPAMEEPPASPVALWGRTSAGARGWLEVPTFDHLTGFVEKIGDTMQGFLTLHAQPVNPFHAATKDYVDLSEPQEAPHDGKYYARSDGQWVEIDPTTSGIEEPPANPVAIWGRSSAGARGWLEVPTYDDLDGFVNKIGDTMTGKLTLDGPPVNPNHAATKDYVDLSEPQEAPYNGKAYARQDGQWVEIEPSGGGIEEPPMQPVAVWGRTPDRGWVEVPTFDDVNGFVSKIGDTMTGALNLRDDSGGLFIPTQPAHAINLDFADLTYLKDAPSDGKQYAREEGAWVEIEETGDTIEEPPMNPVALWGRSSGGARGWIEIPEAVLDSMDEPPMSPVAIWGRSSGGARGWIALDTSGVRVAGDTVDELGVVYVPDKRGLQIGPDGALTARIATDLDHGVILDAPATPQTPDATYVRKFGQWVENTAAQGLTPVGRSPVNGLDSGYDDVLKAQTIWVPLATDKLAGSIVEPPVDGKQYVRVNDAMAGVAWVESLAAGVSIADTAPDPATATPGALWFESDTGALFVFYDDGDSQQWVETGAGAAGGITDAPVDGTPYSRQDAGWVPASSSALTEAPIDGKQYARKDAAWDEVITSAVTVGDAPPATPKQGDLWFDSASLNTFIWYEDATSSQWVQTSPGAGGGSSTDLTGYATEVWVQDQIANAVIDAQAFVTAAASKAKGHDTDLCQQALKAVEGLSMTVKRLERRVKTLEARR